MFRKLGVWFESFGIVERKLSLKNPNLWTVLCPGKGSVALEFNKGMRPTWIKSHCTPETQLRIFFFKCGKQNSTHVVFKRVKIVWKSEISGDLQFELGGKSKDWGITLSAVFRDRVRLKKPSSPWVGTLVVLTYQFPASFWERFEWSEWHWIDTKSLWEKHRFEWSEWDRPLQR